MEKFPFQNKYFQEDKFLNALAEAYRLQEAIISNTELAIISTNEEGVITSVNRATENMLGYAAQEMVGRLTPIIFHDPLEVASKSREVAHELGKAVAPGFEAIVIYARTKKTSDRREWTYIRKDGSKFPVMLSITALWDEKNELIGYASIASDITEQKKIHQKIRESEAHLQILLSSIDDLALEVNKDGVYTNIWTKKDHLLFVQPRDQYIGKTIYEILSGPLLLQFEQAIKAVLHTCESCYLEFELPNNKGWRSGKVSFINDDRVLILVNDITERKKVELALRESEEKFRLLAENIPGVIYLCKNNATHSMVYLNENVKKLTGYAAYDFISGQVNFVQLYHDEDKRYILNLVDKALNDKVSFYLEYRIRHKSGEWRWVEESGVGVYNGNDLLMIEGFINDITDRKHAEEELRRIADENYRVFNYSINLSCVAGFDGFFKKLNPAWEKTFGWSVEELKSENLISFVHPEDVERTTNMMAMLTAGNSTTAFENRYRTKDGSYRWLLWNLSPDLKYKLAYASAIDITDRKKSEEELLRSKKSLEGAALELQEQNRQLDEFAHIISHNLRSPVGNIKALLGFLSEKSTIEDFHLIFEKLRNVANNLGETMNELLETLKVKNTDIETVTLSFQEVLNKVVQSLEGEIIQSRATITADFSAVPEIEYSKTYLESIFQNLLSNALKYKALNRDPKIHISSHQIHGQTKLLVKDNGLGIDLNKFGNKLFGLHKTFHDHQDARGVGLFLTKTQVEAMGGTITADSKVDEGTTFSILFS